MMEEADAEGENDGAILLKSRLEDTDDAMSDLLVSSNQINGVVLCRSSGENLDVGEASEFASKE